jgi:O-antigen ligase
MIGPTALAIAIFSSFLFSDTSYGEFLLLGIAVYIIGLFILNRSEYPSSRLHTFIYLFFIYIAINPYWSINFSLSIVQILILCQTPLIFLLLSNREIQRSWRSYLLFIPILALISSIWGITEYIQIHQNNYIATHRIKGFLDDTSSYAGIQYIFSLLLFSLIYCHTPEKPLFRGAIWLTQLLVITALFLTQSRSGILLWLFIIAIIFIYSFIRKPVNPWKRVVLPIVLITLLAFACVKILIFFVDKPVDGSVFTDRLATYSLEERYQVWRPTLKLIEEKPLFGWGLKTFQSLYPSIRKEYITTGSVTHNDYIQFTLEGGVVLLLFLLLFLGYHLYIFIRLLLWQRSTPDDFAGFELVMMLLANIALLLQSITNFSFYTLQLCILSGVIFSRSYSLAVNIGLVKQPMLIEFTRMRRGILVLLLSAIIFTILYRALLGFLFLNPERHTITRSLSTNMSLLVNLSAVTPNDPMLSTRMATVLTSRVNGVPDIETKKKILDYTISILEASTKAYPYNAAIYANLGNTLHFAYTQLPADREHYKHYADLWMRSIEINPTYFPPYQKLYDDLVSKKRYQEALSLLERVIPWFKSWKISNRNLLLIHEVLIYLGEKTGDELLPLYKKLSLSANQGDDKAYHDVLSEINLRLQNKKHTPEAIQTISTSSINQTPPPLPKGDWEQNQTQ